VRLLSFGQPDAALAEALASEGFQVDVAALTSAPEGGMTAELARALREAESALSDRPAAVLVVGVDDAVVAAALTAVKLDIPTAWVGDRADPVPLVARVAELTLDATADAADGARAVRELAESRLRSQ
jgi:hypothetical protein